MSHIHWVSGLVGVWFVYTLGELERVEAKGTNEVRAGELRRHSQERQCVGVAKGAFLVPVQFGLVTAFRHGE